MRSLRELLLRLRGVFGKASAEARFREEIEAHLEMHAEDNLRRGMSPELARREAVLKLGGTEWARQVYREQGTLPSIENLLSDLRFAARQFRKNLGFSITAISLLGLGLGAAVAIFAFVDAALLKPLPYKEPSHLVGVFEETALCPHCNVSYLNYRDWKQSDLPFTALETWAYSNFLLPESTGTASAPGARVTDGFFRLLGVTPVLGRDFYAGEDAPGSAHTVMISYGAWKRRFGGSPEVIGRTIKLSDETYVVIGVLPPEFHFAPHNAEFWVTLNDPTSCEKRRGCHSLGFGIARLKDGVSVASGSMAMQAVAKHLEKLYPEDRGFSADAILLDEVIAGNIRPILLVLLGGAGLLLLIACVNISSLLLVRAESRSREIAVRGALGASHARLARQFVTESLLLVTLGSLLGFAFAYGSIQLLIRLVPNSMMDHMPYLRELGLNGRVILFAGCISLLAAMLFSATSALRLSRADMRRDLSDGGRGSAGTVWRGLGSKLVVVELAITVVLLLGAGLLSKSLYRLLHLDLGMRPDHLATMQLTLPSSYQESVQIMLLERRIVMQLGQLPGVQSVGITTSLPSLSWGMATNILVAGRPWNGEHNTVPERDVSPEYLSTLGARLLRGRYFTYAEDDPSKPHVGVINEALSKKYFPGEDPIGRQLLYEGSREPIEIVGVVEDVKEGPLDTTNQPTLYDPFSPQWFRSFNVVVRTSQSEQALLPTLTQAIHQIDPGIATQYAMSMNTLIGETQSAYQRRSSAWLIGTFATIALLLSIVGLYGVIAYSVSQRSREIGVRLALGAQRSTVYRLILKEAGWLIAIGMLAGLGCFTASTALIRNLLFGVQIWDMPTVGTVIGVLAIFAFSASYIPARRAAMIDPIEALRFE